MAKSLLSIYLCRELKERNKVYFLVPPKTKVGGYIFNSSREQAFPLSLERILYNSKDLFLTFNNNDRL